ncbi:2-dehydro-3-deoxygluconokinase [Liquorilactobacillus ghanensis DSM 18630]|uniref:2-dehydro-3-deoxygluconokinase n=1 Tax=Liquorilactobacillus ghanensis DSM 18630 TaxID=1423750 RepID=A0A0R1VK75_9LACO|nr:sugar kinase [Liquorilactobacillus ghanensis]KRM06272.1 2-dehydro-3-deoxygluconokinase [Liquorilactobacillus ghanensis DSM 18630]
MTELITAGEPMGLFIAQDKGPLKQVKHFSSRIAGADLNVAIGVARLNHTVKFISRIGEDTFGDQIKDLLQKEKIDLSGLQINSEWKTGFMLKGLADNGRPETDYYRKGSAASHLDIDKLADLDFSDTKILHLGGILAGLSEEGYQATLKLIEMARKNDVQITFDPNLRPTIWDSEDLMIKRTNEIANLCDVMMPNIKEGRILTGKTAVEDIVDYYLQNKNSQIQQVIVNLVDDGSYSKHRQPDGSYQTERVAAIKIPKIIDRIGAGDGFVAGVVSAKLEELSDRDCLRRGSAIGAIQMQNIGDNEGLPNKAELTKFMTENQVD